MTENPGFDPKEWARVSGSEKPLGARMSEGITNAGGAVVGFTKGTIAFAAGLAVLATVAMIAWKIIRWAWF